MSRKEEYIKRYEKLHTGAEGFLGADGKVKAPDVGELFSGIQFVRKFMGDLKHIISREKSISLLDYGCGKGQHLWRPFEKYKHGVLGEFGHAIHEIRLYDPAVPNFAHEVRGLYQVITCADVMEHVPVEDVDGVLEDIATKMQFIGNGGEKIARCYMLFSISGNPAFKSFLDGENLHCTVMPFDWWKEKITSAIKNELSFQLSGDPETDCEVVVYYTQGDKVHRYQWIVTK